MFYLLDMINFSYRVSDFINFFQIKFTKKQDEGAYIMMSAWTGGGASWNLSSVCKFYCFYKIDLLFTSVDGWGGGVKKWSFLKALININKWWPFKRY